MKHSASWNLTLIELARGSYRKCAKHLLAKNKLNKNTHISPVHPLHQKITNNIDPDKGFYKRKIVNIVNIYLPINLNMCFWCSKDGSFKYPQHMFWMRNKENSFTIRTLIWRPEITTFFVIEGRF